MFKSLSSSSSGGPRSNVGRSGDRAACATGFLTPWMASESYENKRGRTKIKSCLMFHLLASSKNLHL